MLLTDFSNGLNTRVSSKLISPAEAVICNNVDLHAKNIKAVLGLSSTKFSGAQKSYYYETGNVVYPGADKKDYLDYQGKLYYTDGNKPKKIISVGEQNLGIQPPTTSSAVATVAGALTGTLQYVYTYYNSADDTESMPSPVTPEVVTTAHRVNVILTASLDPQVTNIFIYRVGNNLTAFTKVAELLNISAVHTDNAIDSSLAIITLQSTLNGPPLAGLRFLTEEYGTFFGAVDSKLYYSRDIGNPNYWPPVSEIDFHRPITGIAKSPLGIIVFTTTQCFGLSGSVAGGFRKFLISGTQGCIEYKSIVNVNHQLYFVSSDGICSLNRASVTVLTRPRLDKLTLNVVNAVAFDDAYYCQLKDGRLLVMDGRFGFSLYYLNFNTTWLFTALDHLYAEVTVGSFEMFKGSPIQYQYKTGDLVDTAPTAIKIYSTVYLSFTGQLTLTVYIDGQIVLTKAMTSQVLPTQIGLPQLKQRGTSISFEMKGTGTVDGIFYSAVGPQNA